MNQGNFLDAIEPRLYRFAQCKRPGFHHHHTSLVFQFVYYGNKINMVCVMTHKKKKFPQ